MKTLLFFDDVLFSRQRNVTRRFHTPQWMRDAVYLDNDCRLGIGYTSVCPAPGGGYLLYYITILKGNRIAMGMARSDDAIHWTPQRFNPPRVADYDRAVYPTDGIKHGSGMSVYHDPDDPDPARRYKMVDDIHVEPHRLCMAYSPDGVAWTQVDEHRVLESGSDTMLSLLRNHVTGRYQVHLRGWTADRRIFRVESEDCVTWSPPRLVLHPGPTDPPMMQFYGMPQFRYGDLYLGFLWNYHTPFDTPQYVKHTGRVETELVYSYDGLTWTRTHRAFMPRDDWGAFGGGEHYGCAIIERENDLLIYSSANLDEHQHVSRKNGEGGMGLVIGTLRRDGFVGMTTADGGIGEIYTDCLYPRTAELTLNVNTPRGSVRVAVCDVECNPIPGYTRDDCTPVTGDGIRLPVRWKNHHDLSGAIQTAAGHERAGWVRLHFQLDRAELFAIHGDFGCLIRSGGRGTELS